MRKSCRPRGGLNARLLILPAILPVVAAMTIPGVARAGVTYNAGTIGNFGVDASSLSLSSAQESNVNNLAIGYSEQFDSAANDLGPRAAFFNNGVLINLGTFGTDSNNTGYSNTIDINGSNAIVGVTTAYDAANNNLGQRGFVWRNNVMQDIGTLGLAADGTGYADTIAVNNSGIVIGNSEQFDASNNDLGARGVVWQNGTLTSMGTLGTDATGFGNSSAVAVNSAGLVIGQADKYDASNNYLGRRAVSWQSGVLTELPNLGLASDNSTITSVTAMNDTGTIIGSAEKYNTSHTDLGQRGVFWKNGVITDIGTLGTADATGTATAFTTAVNAAGTVIGASEKYTAAHVDQGLHGVVYKSGALTDIGTLGTDATGVGSSNAVAINTAGTVVGSSELFDASHNDLGLRGIVWSSNVLTNVGTPLINANGDGFSESQGITDSGVIWGDYQAVDPTDNSISGPAFAFVWTQAGGLQTADQFLSGGLNSGGWQSLNGITSISPTGVITGFGTRLDGSTEGFVGSLVTTLTTLAWTGGGANSNWNTAGNWTANGLGGIPVSGEGLLFDGNNTTANNNQTGLNVTGITFAPTAGAFNLTGNAITLGGDVIDYSPSAQRIAMPLTLSASRTISVSAGGGAMTVTSAIGDGGGGFGLTLINNNLNKLQAGLNGVFSTGSLTLTAACTYTGPSVVQSGNLVLNFAAAGAPASNIVSASSPLTLGATLPSLPGVGILTVTGTSATVSQTFSGTTIGIGQNAISATSGAGGTTNVNLAAITYVRGGAVNFTRPSSGAISASAAISNGILGGWATVGGTDWATIAGGSVAPYTGYTDVTGAPAISVPAGSNVRWSGSTGNATIGVAATTTDINSLLYSDTGTTNRTLTIAGTLRLGAFGGVFRTNTASNNTLTVAGGTLTAGGAAGQPGEIAFTVNQNGNNNSNDLTVSSIVADNGGDNAPVTVVKSGPGSLVLSVANTYTGGTYIDEGRISMNNATALGTGPVYVEPGGHLFVTTGTVTNSLYLAGLGSIENAGNWGAMRVNGATIAGSVQLTGDARITSGSATAVITGAISGIYDLELLGVGSNTLTISSTDNRWTGDTTINQGTLKLGAGEVIPNGFGSGNVILNGSTTNAVLDLNGKSETIDGLNSAGTATADIITSSVAGAVTLTLGDNNAAGSFGGVIQNGSGTVAVTKLGAGAQTLSGINTFTGSTTVSAGTLTLATGGSLASSVVSIVPGATMNINGLLAATATVNANGIANFGGSTGSAVLNRPLSALNIAAGVIAAITPSAFPFTPAVLHPTTLALANPTSKLDLTNNELITTGSAIGALAQIISGQLFTSSAGGTPGYLDLGGGAVEIRFTLPGDTNLDGIVNVSDLGNLASNFGATSGALWVQGDFDRNGTVNVADLGDLATNFGSSLAAGTGEMTADVVAEVATPVGAVPEPVATAFIALSLAWIARRAPRRRQSSCWQHHSKV